VLVDVATMVTAGGEAIADIDTLRHQQAGAGSGRVTTDGVAGPGRADPGIVEAGRDGAGEDPGPGVGPDPGGLPASRVAGTDPAAEVMVLDVDATIVIAHSEKETRRPTFKKTFGYHPIGGLVR
jgi:hypothetical protein